MNTRRPGFSLVILSASMLVLGGCDQNPHVRLSQELADSLHSSQPENTRAGAGPNEGLPDGAQFGCPADPPPEGALRLFLDATRSMEGFTGGPQEFTEFDGVLARIATQLGIDRVVLFGETEARNGLYRGVPFSPNLHEPQAYDGLNNPDYCLVTDLTEGPVGVSLYLTDGVQSSGVYGPQAPMVRVLRAWLESGRGLEILALSSSFSGPAWSEQRKAWIGRADIDARPFYLFIFASSPADAHDVLARLRPLFAEASVRLSFTPDPVSCFVDLQYVQGHYQLNPEYNWIYYRRPRPSPDDRKLSERLEPGAVQCRFSESYPLQSMVAANSVRFYGWEGRRDGFNGPVSPPPSTTVRTDSVLSSSMNGALIPIRVQLPLMYGIGMYAVDLEVTPGRIRADVASLSTDSDSDLADFEQTYRFDWLIEPLIRAQLGNIQVRFPLFILVEP